VGVSVGGTSGVGVAVGGTGVGVSVGIAGVSVGATISITNGVDVASGSSVRTILGVLVGVGVTWLLKEGPQASAGNIKKPMINWIENQLLLFINY
jgi:hypothetical protein